MEIQEILDSLEKGKITSSTAKKLLSLYSIETIENFAKIDVNRRKRRGIPEVVFAQTKQLDEIKKIIKTVLEKTNLVLVSKIKEEHYSNLIAFGKKSKFKIKTGKHSSTLLFYQKPIKFLGGKVGIITAGTSDIGIAEEAKLMCEAMNCKCITSYDVGVAGIQRIFPVLKEMVNEDVECIIVVAGMEGALATLVSAMTDIPVIGVPVSVGYGYGEKGIAALASMLQSCALGLSVVNIDGGIAAGSIAANIANRSIRKVK
ncbi:MAG: nickel pincer cofactor biosynthesis protein LarB [Nitrosopumilaceae archaeon]|nr:nickel pincer cofactor biosynthesis protein LarB [Nitrosopumilaceae archaeon]